MSDTITKKVNWQALYAVSLMGVKCIGAKKYGRDKWVSPNELPENIIDFLSIKRFSKTSKTWIFDTSNIRELKGKSHGDVLIWLRKESKTNESYRVMQHHNKLQLKIAFVDEEKIELKNIFSNLGGVDGSHNGLTDIYPEKMDVLKEALQSKHGKYWTTGWYASKKQIASCKISFADDNLTVEVSVSDDFDTNGTGCVETPCKALKKVTDADILKLHEMIDQASYEAEQDKKDNNEVLMYCIGNRKGDKRTNWIETFLVNISMFPDSDFPPGDNYHQWGFQEETGEIPEDVKKLLEDKMGNHQAKIRCKNWIAECVND